MVVLQAEFDRTAQLVSDKAGGAGGEPGPGPVPGSVSLHDLGTFKQNNPEAEAFLNSDLWKNLQQHIRVVPKETVPDVAMGQEGTGVHAAGADAGGNRGEPAAPGTGQPAERAPGEADESVRLKRNNELSELSTEEQRQLWANCDSFEDFTAKLEELYVTKRARYS